MLIRFCSAIGNSPSTVEDHSQTCSSWRTSPHSDKDQQVDASVFGEVDAIGKERGVLVRGIAPVLIADNPSTQSACGTRGKVRLSPIVADPKPRLMRNPASPGFRTLYCSAARLTV